MRLFYSFTTSFLLFSTLATAQSIEAEESVCVRRGADLYVQMVDGKTPGSRFNLVLRNYETVRRNLPKEALRFDVSHHSVGVARLTTEAGAFEVNPHSNPGSACQAIVTPAGKAITVGLSCTHLVSADGRLTLEQKSQQSLARLKLDAPLTCQIVVAR